MKCGEKTKVILLCAIEAFGETYPAMSINNWVALARKYAEKRLHQYDMKDNEAIDWMAAEDDLE